MSFLSIILISCIPGIIRLNPLSRSQLTVFLAGKLFFLIYRVVIPCLILPVWKVVRYYSTNKRGSRLKREFCVHAHKQDDLTLFAFACAVILSSTLPHSVAKRLSPELFSALEPFGSPEGSVLS